MNENIVNKPWGWYRVIEDKVVEGLYTYKLKEICLFPKSSISLQSHNNREEVWKIIEGMGELFVAGTTKLVDPTSEPIYIKKLNHHKITNNENFNLKFLEIQYGEKCEEEDIIRYEDQYGRT